MVVLGADLEHQIRLLKFKGELEQEYVASAADERHRRVTIATCLVTAVLILGNIAEQAAGELPSGYQSIGIQAARIGGWIMTGLLPLTLSALMFYKPFRRYGLASFAASVCAIQIWFGVINNIGEQKAPGIEGAPTVTLIHLVLIILVVATMRAPTRMAALFCVAVWTLTFAAFSYRGASEMWEVLTMLLVAETFLVLASYFNETADRRSFIYRRFLIDERDRIEVVLNNMLPKQIAHQLKDSPDVIAEYHPEATVLFADVVDFTPFAASKTPGEVVGFLNEVFSRFDTLAEQFHVEKIKTVGDAYMVAAGLPDARADHLEAIADMALEMRGVASALGVTMRIGFHSGPLVAGVIGKKKYLYDLWGDTVNIASRMESHGVPGGIHLTQDVASRLGPEYETERVGEVEVKGMGTVSTCLLLRKRVAAIQMSSKAQVP